MHSRRVNGRQTFPTASHRPSHVSVAIFRGSASIFEKAISMGFGSGPCPGRNANRAPSLSGISAAFGLRWEVRLSSTTMSPSRSVGARMAELSRGG